MKINIERNSGNEWRQLGQVEVLDGKIVDLPIKLEKELAEIIASSKGEGMAVVNETAYRWGEFNCTKDIGFTPVPNDSGDCMTMLGPNVACPNCGSPPAEHEVRNHSLMWHDGDVHCTRCGAYVRMYDAG